LLTKEAITEIVKIQMKHIENRLSVQNIKLKYPVSVVKHLAEEGYNPSYGARPLKRVIQNKILDAIAQLIVAKRVKEGDTVTLGVTKGAFNFTVAKGKRKSVYKEADISETALVG